MKKLLLFIFVLSFAVGMSQTAQIEYPGGTVTTAALDSVTGTASYYYFVFKNRVNAYAIQMVVKDSICYDSTIAILQGSNYMGEFTAIDTLVVPNAQKTFTTPKVITGTTAPFGIYRFVIPEDSLKCGSLYFYIRYQ